MTENILAINGHTPSVAAPTRDILPELATMSVSDTAPCSTAAPWMTEPLSV